MAVDTTTDLLAAALDYAQKGWPVFPCSNRDKRPLVPGETSKGAKDGGLYLATTDEEQIRTWWKKWPKAMIAVPTGPLTGNVIDLDLGDPQVITGAEYLDRLRDHVGGIPDTAITETGSGGYHIWTTANPEAPVANGANIVPDLYIAAEEGTTTADGKKAKGAQIDTRGQGGYVIVPPSVRADGKAYSWCPDPWDGIADPTPGMLRILNKDEAREAKEAKRGKWDKRPSGPPAGSEARPRFEPTGDAAQDAVRRYAESAFDKEISALSGFVTGSRNVELNKAGFRLGQLVGAGALAESMVRAGLEEASRINGLIADDGMKTVQDTIDSGVGAGMRKPRDLSGIGAKARRAEQRQQEWNGGASSADGNGEQPNEDTSDTLIRRTGLEYPIPVMSAPRLFYETHRGRVMLHKEVPGKNDKPPSIVPVATPFGVTARLRYADREGAYGLRVAIQDMAGVARYVDVDRSDLARQGGAPIRERLFREGLKTEDDGEHIAIKCLKAAAPQIEITVVSSPGWHEDEDFPTPVFVCPDGTVAGSDQETALELAMATRLSPMVAHAGTLDGWREAVEVAINVERCEHWTLGAAAAFVGPILSITGLDTCGINLSGLSSSGKSTCQRIAVSAWSTPDMRKPGLAYSAKSTANAMEGLAARANGTVFSLDEMAHVSGQEVAKMIYTLAGGVGKRRMTADAAMRDSYTWSTFALLSSECSLEEKVKGDKGDWVAGMAARFADVDVSTVNRDVDRPILDRIEAVSRNFGHAGPAFVQALIAEGIHKEPVALRERILAQAKIIAGPNADSTRLRAAIPFALLNAAGTMAMRYGLIPKEASIAGCVDWAWRQFMKSSDARALDPREQVVANLRSYVLARWAVTIRHVGSGGGAQKAEGWFDNAMVYLPRETLRVAAGNIMTEETTAGILAEKELLGKTEGDGRLHIRYVKGVGKTNAYALKRSEFGREDDPVGGYSTGRGSEF